MDKTSHKLCVIFLKFAPIIGAILMWLHVSLLLMGVKFYLAENLIALPIIPCLTAMIWSKTFGFCSMHRHFIAYITAVTYCINWQSDFVGFGDALTLVRWILWFAGLILLIWFAKCWKTKKYKICKNE